jgi:LemA protein
MRALAARRKIAGSVLTRPHDDRDWLYCRGNGSAYRQRSEQLMVLSRFDRVPRLVPRLAALLVVLLGLAGCDVNAVPRQDEAVKAAWSQVLNQYQRRADLIPNLVETVKGYARQEQQVLTAVTEARAKATQMQLPADILTNPQAFQEFEKNQGALTGALGRLLAVSERYPDLKSDQNFLALQSQLEGTENRIAVARRDYIDAVQQYNTTLRTIPSRWVAALLYPDAKVRETFTITAEAQQVPQVKF